MKIKILGVEIEIKNTNTESIFKNEYLDKLNENYLDKHKDNKYVEMLERKYFPTKKEVK